MEPKRTKQTPKPGENKPADVELLRGMVSLSNNSRLTQDTARLLTNKLDAKELRELKEWIRHAGRMFWVHAKGR